MTLFFDTETTGIVDFRAPLEHPSQPHIVQLAAMLCDDELNPVSEIKLLVRPNGFEIPKEASAVHGITTERAERYGVSLRGALSIFGAMLRNVDLIVAHSLDFDRTMVLAECFRMRQWESILEVKQVFIEKPGFCTMKAATPICRLPGKFADSYKWPKLQEAHRHFFKEDFNGAHDAMADVKACARIYREIVAMDKGRPVKVE